MHHLTKEACMKTKCYTVEQCVHRGILYLAESLQYYWPANFSVANAKEQPFINEIAENNIALHLSRSFAEDGFQVWAEVPFNKENRRIDFLAYSYADGISVALEFKKSIDTPQGNLEDLKRLIDIHDTGLCNPIHEFNNQSLNLASYKMYGIVVLLSATEFADWWMYPSAWNYTPDKRFANDYSTIGKALDVSKHRYVVPIIEYFSPGTSEDMRYRFRRAAYALYDSAEIESLRKILCS